MGILKKRSCAECGVLITFEQFCHNHHFLSPQRALNLWNDPLLSFYCMSCFLNRPEKPYKVRRRDATYFRKKVKYK